MQRRLWPLTIRAIGLALQFGVASAFAQSAPATTPSTPPVNTPPLPAANPPTGGPNSLPTGEPANTIANGGAGAAGLSKGANPFTEAEARSRLQQHGYRQVSALTKDPDGIWHGSAVREATRLKVGLDSKGHISSN